MKLSELINSNSKATKAKYLKRKRTSSSGKPATDIDPSNSTKRIATDKLAWKTITTAALPGMDEVGGMMMLEELDDVGVEWDLGVGGSKVAKFVEVAPKAKKSQKIKNSGPLDFGIQKPDLTEDLVDAEEIEAEEISEADDALPEFSKVDQEDVNDEDDEVHLADEPFDDDLLPEWTALKLHPSLKRSIHTLDYQKPTQIQSRAIPLELEGRDVVGVAETGSGKTLAYSLPILSHLLHQSPDRSTRRPLSALILCPTRELALQVMDHLVRVTRQFDSISANKAQKKAPRVSIGSVIGGLSAQKQKRILERGADILVATPGRIWDLIKSDDQLASDIRQIRFLVIDEADRMIENGHFAELENIVKLTQRQSHMSHRTVSNGEEEEEDPIFANIAKNAIEQEARKDMQTFVFSATLSKDLQENLKRKRKSKPGTKKATALEDLVERLDFRDPKPEVFDLSPEGGTVAQLRESMIECITADKDLYLYYFLLRYPGGSIVFVGSIDGIRRLTPLFEMLKMPVYPLHSQLQQRQRLKNLDRFKSTSNAALIATDVAARGLDIPQVDHVIHFNLPRTADAYIHRSGRTARAQNLGFALQIVSPEERGVQRALMKSLGRDQEVPELPIEGGFLPNLKERVRVARAIEKAQHEAKKEIHDKNWLKEAAEAMDIDMDPDMLSEADSDADRPYHKSSNKVKSRNNKASQNLESLKLELKALLSKPLMARGVSAKYPTSGSKVIIDDIIKSTGHGTLLGAGVAKAYDEVVKPGKKIIGGKRKNRR